MAELQHLSQFIEQNSHHERSIRCTPEGISLEKFVEILVTPGAPEDVRQRLQPFVLVLRGQPPPSEDGKAIDSAFQNILSLLIAKVGLFDTMEGYGWLARATMGTALLSGLPCYDSSLVKRLLSALEEIELASFNYSPLVIHHVTACLLQDIPLQGVNLLYVIKKLAITNSQVLYYVAVSLVFAGLAAITNTETQTHQLHTVDEFLGQLDLLNMEQLHQQRNNLQIIYQLLKLLSLYENMVLLRHFGKPDEELEAEHKCLARMFRVSEEQRKKFHLWLEKSSALVNLFGNDRDMDYLILADIIQVDMLPLLDEANQPDDLS